MEKECVERGVSAPLLNQSSNNVACIMHRDAEEDSQILEIRCLYRPAYKTATFYFACIASGGLLFLLQWWILKLHMTLRYSESSISAATHLYVRTSYTEEIITTTLKITNNRQQLLTFEYHHLPYYLKENRFEPLFMQTSLSYKNIIDTYGQGIIAEEEIEEKKNLYGKCAILVPMKPIPRLMVEEILHPFYMFQVFSVCLWMWDGYVFYASAIFVITVVSLTTSIRDTIINLKNIRTMAFYECKVTAIRSGEKYKISSTELVPGDLIEIPEDTKMPCDAVLLSGGCIMDEAMLTGESVPVLKDSLPYHENSKYDIDLDRRHSLYEGTFVIQTRNYGGNQAIGIVTRTGFMTMKGKLVRSILFPKPNKFKFYQDSLKFIIVLALFSLIGFAVSLPIQIQQGVDIASIIDRSLDLFTITVPPALPAAMSIGTVFAINRLRKHNIFCISPPRVNVAGKIDQVVFDKTGTLTEDGMDLLGVRAVLNSKFIQLEPHPKSLHSSCTHLVECLASCHSLTTVHGKLLGDTQDVRIFESTGWKFEEPNEALYDSLVKGIVRPGNSGMIHGELFDASGNALMIKPDYEIGILHIFHFNSKLKRMGVIVKNLQDDQFRFFLKGAPEVVTSLCKSESLPEDLNLILGNYTRSGYRVLACATKSLPTIKYEEIRKISLEDMENDLEFLGLIVLQNKLKPETTAALKVLHDAGLKTIMATGDAALTGISVARECGIINPDSDVYLGEMVENEIVWSAFTYNKEGGSQIVMTDPEISDPAWYTRSATDDFVIAISGVAFASMLKRSFSGSFVHTSALETLLRKAKIFARMSPDHKSALIEELQNRGLLVAMCGDGANDCGALKTANVGISLSEAEASIAAPFTSRISNITCVIQVLQEGRCALSTSMQCFKYMALYSMIQFSSVTMLYFFQSNLSDLQFLIIDLFTILPLAIAMCYTGPYHKLSKRQPTATLISSPVLASVIGQTIIQIGFQLVSYYLLYLQDFYTQLDPSDNIEENYYCYENTTLFLISNFQYLAICIVFSIGKPWKKPAYTNIYLTVVFCVLMAFSVYIIVYPAEWARYITDTKHLDFSFRMELLGVCIGYLAIAYLYERGVVNFLDYLRDKRSNRKKALA